MNQTCLFSDGLFVFDWWESIPKSWDPKRRTKTRLFWLKRSVRRSGFFNLPQCKKRDKLVTSDAIFLGDLGTGSFFGGKFFQGKMELGSLMVSGTAHIFDKSVRMKKNTT